MRLLTAVQLECDECAQEKYSVVELRDKADSLIIICADCLKLAVQLASTEAQTDPRTDS